MPDSNDSKFVPYEKSYLVDIVYGIEAMTKTLAFHIRSLRIDQHCQHEFIATSLNPGFSADYSLGQELCRQAREFLKENDVPEWD